MEIEIIKSDGDLKREVWKFKLFADIYLPYQFKICAYSFQKRKTKRHNWQKQTSWERWDKRRNTVEHPPLPSEIITEMRDKFIEMIQQLPVSE
jgi:hypothetical protein